MRAPPPSPSPSPDAAAAAADDDDDDDDVPGLLIMGFLDLSTSPAKTAFEIMIKIYYSLISIIVLPRRRGQKRKADQREPEAPSNAVIIGRAQAPKWKMAPHMCARQSCSVS